MICYLEFGVFLGFRISSLGFINERMKKSRKLPNHVLESMKNYPCFYKKVWLTCSKIPKGKTMTYGELAKIIGSPKAARAVGSALGKNPFAPIVPCHRVIRSDGKLGGYSGIGGVKKKIEMLRKEGVTIKC